jgi:hypothetical protein
MLGSEVLDVAIGVIFVFLLVSLMASAIREGIESWLKTRATHLEKGIRELLYDRDGNGLAQQFFEHPLIYTLYAGDYTVRDVTNAWRTGGGNMPSYIPSRNFAVALMDLAARGPGNSPSTKSPATSPISVEMLRQNLSLLPSPQVRRILLTAIDNAQGDIQKTQAYLEAWYDGAMERVSGWYKRSTQRILFVIGLVIAIVLNVNTMTIVATLYQNKAAREALVGQAQAAVKDPNFTKQSYADVKNDINSLPLPIGWSSQKPQTNNTPVPPESDSEKYKRYLQTLAGWLLTALAASLGAPFWFDTLSKIMTVRSTLKPQAEAPAADKTKADATPAASVPPASGTGTAPPAAAPANPADLDGCDVQMVGVTKDEDLPAAKGGVR